jgi:hypothetical protein
MAVKCTFQIETACSIFTVQWEEGDDEDNGSFGDFNSRNIALTEDGGPRGGGGGQNENGMQIEKYCFHDSDDDSGTYFHRTQSKRKRLLIARGLQRRERRQPLAQRLPRVCSRQAAAPCGEEEEEGQCRIRPPNFIPCNDGNGKEFANSTWRLDNNHDEYRACNEDNESSGGGSPCHDGSGRGGGCSDDDDVGWDKMKEKNHSLAQRYVRPPNKTSGRLPT